MSATIMSFEESWNMELQKARFYKDKNIKWQNYFVLKDFLKENNENLKFRYKTIYEATNFETFKNLIPKWMPYHVIFNCGVGGIYNEIEEKIYISVNPKTKINIFYDTLIHEYCHIKYNYFFYGLPHDFLEEGIEVIAAKKYGIYSFDYKKYNLFNTIELDHLRSSILKAASKHNLLIEENNNDVFTFIP